MYLYDRQPDIPFSINLLFLIVEYEGVKYLRYLTGLERQVHQPQCLDRS